MIFAMQLAMSSITLWKRREIKTALKKKQSGGNEGQTKTNP